MIFGSVRAASVAPIAPVASSAVAIAALFYVGGAWFGGAPAPLVPAGSETVIVFDRSLRVAAGAAPGTPLLSRFPEPLRPEIEMRCRLALKGEHTHFDCEHAGARFSFDIAPVPSIHGMVLYGVLITGSGKRVPAATASPLTTVA